MFASLNMPIMTNNVHPLYLPPAVCWLNKTYVQMRNFKSALFHIIKWFSVLVILLTIFVHATRLCHLTTVESMESLWSLTVCITLAKGLVLAMISSDHRSNHSNTSTSMDPMAGISVYLKLIMVILLFTTYFCTWVYYNMCERSAMVTSSSHCIKRLARQSFPILTLTLFTIVWINAIGLVRLLGSI